MTVAKKKKPSRKQKKAARKKAVVFYDVSSRKSLRYVDETLPSQREVAQFCEGYEALRRETAGQLGSVEIKHVEPPSDAAMRAVKVKVKATLGVGKHRPQKRG